MNLIILAVAIFLTATVFILCLLYLFITPGKDRALRNRLQAIAQRDQVAADESNLLHDDILSQIPALNHFLGNISVIVKLNNFIQQAGMDIPVGKLLALIILIYTGVSAVGVLLQRNLLMVLLLALIAASIPLIVVAIKRQRRFAKFEEQFPEAIDLMARAVRAGHAFTTGFELIGKEMSDPVASEFRMTFDQQNLGLPLRTAFLNLLNRIPLPDVHIFVTALNIQRESGGNLAEILDNLANIIRERFKLKKQVNVYTAQGRMSLYVLSAIAPGMGFLFYIMNPDYISVLFTSALGQKLVIAAVVFQILGFFTISRIVRPKV